MSDPIPPKGQTRHAVSDLGLSLSLVGDEVHGKATIRPELHVPGTQALRTSILAAWVDVLTGIQCIDSFEGRVPVTLDLSVNLIREAVGLGQISAVTRTLKVGRSVAIAEVEFTGDDSDQVLALGTATFMAAPDTSLRVASRAELVAGMAGPYPPLELPFAERVGCVRGALGTACLPRSDDGMNASRTINGGLIALVAEEAVLNGAPAGTTLSSMAFRYLRPARVGPVVGHATTYGDTARTEVRDAGADNRIAVLATSRAFPTRG